MDAQRHHLKSRVPIRPSEAAPTNQEAPWRAKWAPLLGTLRASWPLITIIVIQALIALYSIYILSAVRTYVGGESLWSKGQKEAIYQLSRYALTGDNSAYAAYAKALSIPLGNRDARVALMHGDPDHVAASIGLAKGGNHSDDIGSAINLMLFFGTSALMRDTVKYWEIGDQYIVQIKDLGDEIHSHWQSGIVDSAIQDQWLTSINQLNTEIAPFAASFTTSLGHSSRLVVQILMWTTACTAVLMGVLIVWRNYVLIMQRERVQRALNNERKQAKVTLAAIGDGVVTTDAAERVLYMNHAAERILALPEAQAQGRPLHEVLRFESRPNGACTAYESEADTAHQDPSRQIRQIQRHDGQVISVRTVTTNRSGFEGDVDGKVVVLHDATQEQSFLEQVSWHANHDSLTYLMNRRAFERRLQQVLSQPRQVGAEGVLLYIDIDQFKLVNDTCGHQAGDFILREICAILQSKVSRDQALARLGGDEFGILLLNHSLQAGMAIAEQLRYAVRETRFRWQERELSTGLSIGMVLLSNEFDTMEEVMRLADMACYQAKDDGRNRVCLYEPHNDEFSRLHNEMDWIRRLRNALDTHRFELHAQPLLDLQNGPNTSAGVHIELLLRLRDERGNLVPPGTFIPAAELYGLMPEIDRWVIRHAFKHLRNTPRIQGQLIGLCAINLSATSIGDPELLEYIHEQFSVSRIDPALICFEVTETSAITKLAQAQSLITSLRQIGCRFALDDFGAGMSSFRYLKHLPVDILKIDGSLIVSMLEDPASLAMVEMINHLAHMMEIQTVAEFAENSAIIDQLRTIGVNYAQGYGVSQPLPFMTTKPAPIG
ncbi:EAL domain-containing protein [Lampropedia aestuarii]|uniref:EAL domain-containing protein n=1 Tax=Lampropedia aestuarii TaxID=2562762 RepID=UPI002469832C|nr:EAL domain-containing protein [Lampropedia aestuarii]MDH5856826.1 EAL domain-containing protein [Lampropedia aestuarii]